jgi:hypothetical protein
MERDLLVVVLMLVAWFLILVVGTVMESVQ